MKNKIAGVIPARYASSRFPGKPLAKINGKEMILWVIEGAQKSKILDTLIVATDDHRIREVVEGVGVQAMMTDSSLPSGTDRVHAAIKDMNFEIIVNIQGDEPLLTAPFIDNLVWPLLEDSKLEMTTLAHEISPAELLSENSVKVVMNDKSEALYFSRFPIPYSRVQPIPGKPFSACLKHIGMYAYRIGFLARFCQTPPAELEMAESLEQLRALAMGARIKVVPIKERSWGVDTPQDMAKIEEMLRDRK